jgi:hypothetical protein
LGSALGFVVVVIVIVFPLVFITVIKEIKRCGEWPSTGVRDIAEFELCLIDNSRSGFDINPLWRQKFLQLLEGTV